MLKRLFFYEARISKNAPWKCITSFPMQATPLAAKYQDYLLFFTTHLVEFRRRTATKTFIDENAVDAILGICAIAKATPVADR